MGSVGIVAVAIFLFLGSLLGFGVVTVWLERGAIPTVFVDQPLPIALWNAFTLLLKCAGALVAAVQLFRQRRSGRLLATVVVANDALHTEAGPLLGMGSMDPARWGAVVLCALVLTFLWSPPGVAAADRRG